MITEPSIEKYCIDHSTPPTKAHEALIIATHQTLPAAARMQVGALEGRFLTLITQITRSKTVLEFGTFTGYSALSFANGVPENGRVTTLDIDPKATAIAKEHWNQSTDGHKIELILGSALETVKKLEAEIKNGSRPAFDLIFIDADKGNYENYYEASLKVLAPQGVILVDNVLWDGAVLHPKDPTDHTIVKFNQKIKEDTRVEKIMIPIRDGIYLIRKKD